MLTLQNLSAGYGGKTVLHGITLDFPPGTLTAILGPNGCGKSTLLKAAAGLLPATGGQVRADEPRARHIAYLPQSGPLPEMTARQLVLHGRFPWLGWPRVYRREDAAIAENAMERLGIGEFADRPLAELSGGTRQRCFLAMALAQQAETVLLDEPTSWLDIGHRFRLMELLRSLAAGGRAVAAVLHDLPLALGYADRVAVLAEGRLRFLGTPEEALASGILEEVFEVRVLRADTPAGAQFVCVPK